MSIETIARRYASALADVVVGNGQTDEVRSELREWETMLTTNSELHSAFANPSIAHNNKEKVLEDLIALMKPSQTTANFLRVLLRNSRLTKLDSINEKFRAVLDERRGVTSASVKSARELTEAERSELKANLEKMSGKQVNLEFEIDKNVIGGSVTRLGSVIYDGSVKSQLESLREQMINS